MLMAEESAVEYRTMFQVLLMAGSMALHKLNMIRLVDLLRRTGQVLMSSGLLSLAKRLIHTISLLLEQGVMIKNKPHHIDRSNLEFGHIRAVAKTTDTPVLESHLEICSFGKHHLPTVASFKNSNVCIMNLSQSCNCCCGSIGRCITTKGQVPFDCAVACVMGHNMCRSYFETKNDMENYEPSTDIMACEYTRNKAVSVELMTSVTGLMTSSVNRLSSADSGIGNVCLSVRETVTTSSCVKENCALMSEMAQMTMVGEGSAAHPQSFPPWGTGHKVANLLPVSGCVYDIEGRLIRMTVHSQSADSDCSSSCTCSDGETEDIFELFWQPGDGDGDDEYFENRNSFDDDCPSDDSDVFICFEDSFAVQNCCAEVSIILEPSNFANPFNDTSECFDYDKKENDEDCPRKRVSFKSGSDLVEIHQMVAWNFAYHSARKGPWEREAADRAHFKQRIKEVEPVLALVIQKRLNKLSSSEMTFNQTAVEPGLEG